jgi:ribonucleoside-triphosphate reductase
MCMVGSCAVSGGMRRTAMISLFDKDDEEMLHIKDSVEDYETYLFNANNSVVWEDEVPQADFIRHFSTLFASGNGEPGIFNRVSARNTRPDRREDGIFGTNPCGEISLLPLQFCNLSNVICRVDDTLDDLKEKVAIATIIGTIQSMATHFPGLRPQWKENAEKERLLGVGLDGQMDSELVRNPEVMRELKNVATTVNAAISKKLKISQSVSITCVKPSGNTSVLVNCSAGLHGRPAPYYIRRVRISRTDPVFYVLSETGVPMFPEVGQMDDPRTWVAEFPVKSPDGAVTKNRLSAIEQCEYWLTNKVYWTDHNPSCTVFYRKHEMIELMNWIWVNRDRIGGLSFMPYDDTFYELAPEEEISQEEYEKRVAEFPSIDFSRITFYETSDQTNAAQEVACVANLCAV